MNNSGKIIDAKKQYDNILSQFWLYYNYSGHLYGKKRGQEKDNRFKSAILFVEGLTDIEFYQKKIHDYVALENIQYYIDRIDYFRGSKVHNCDAIIMLLNIIYCGGKRNSSIKVDCYGIIDRDYRSELPDNEHVFATDTHDLETLALSSDPGLLYRLNIDITQEQIEEAKLLAYELADVRKKIYEDANNLNHRKINEENGTVDFSKLVEGKDLSIKKILKRLEEQRLIQFSDSRYKELFRILSSNRGLRIDNDGVYALSIQPRALLSLMLENPKRWEEISGHDLCSALMHVNNKARKEYWEKWETERFLDGNENRNINRKLEMAIIDQYNSACFKNTDLYKALSDAALIQKIS